MSRNGFVRTLGPEDANPCPFKAGFPSPLRSIPGGDLPEVVKPDLMHVFNIGIGGDLAASGLISLCHLKVFGNGSLPYRLDKAFDRFCGWCTEHHHSAHVKSFEKSTFKIVSPHSLSLATV